MTRLDRRLALVFGLFALTMIIWPAGRPARASEEFIFTKVVLEGEAAPGTEAGTVFGPLTGLFFPALPNLDESGRVSFAATLEGQAVDPSNRTGVWSGSPGAISLFARAGEEAADAAPAVWASFPLDFALFPPATGAGRLGFGATLTGSEIEFTNDDGSGETTRAV